MAAEAKAQTELQNFKNVFSLEGKVAVVTGGSRGLGLHAASGYVSPALQTLRLALETDVFVKPLASRLRKGLHYFS